jgi:hypothetical protein
MLIGSAGGYLSFSDFLAPIFGILLGPYLGGLTVLIGNFGAIGFGRATNFPTLFGAADFLPDFVAALSTGFLMRRQWLPVVTLNAGLLALFFVNPLTSILVTVPGTSIEFPFAWLHIAAFIVLLTPLARWAPKWIESGGAKIAAGVAVLTFIGTMMQHLTGNLLFEVAYGQISPPIIPTAAWPAEWAGVFFAYPIERTILIVCAVLIGTPIIMTVLRNHFLRIGKVETPKTAEPKQPTPST